MQPKAIAMSEVELILLNDTGKCTLYSIQFSSESESEYERFYSKFIEDARLNPDLLRIVQVVDRIAEQGALERFFHYEGKMNDSVVALPVLNSKLRLYCLRLSDTILILGNGGVKNSRTYEEDDSLRGYVLTLQKFEELLKDGQRDGSVTITEKTIETDKTFEL
ncbi:MAG: hypothetical protein NC324_11070 [Bacteroides sp.]|nr:hypothetical protein [Bacteroides sp.]